MHIKLPNNAFGIAVMLLAIALVAVVPFVLVLWLMREIDAPAWVSWPVALSASLLSIFSTVKLKGQNE